MPLENAFFARNQLRVNSRRLRSVLAIFFIGSMRERITCVHEQSRNRSADCPPSKRCSLTLDNGREFARPLDLERHLSLPVYFAHPCHAREPGTDENTNDLLRQYLTQTYRPDAGHGAATTRLRTPIEPPAAQVSRLPQPLRDFHAREPGQPLPPTLVGSTLKAPWRRIGRCREATRAPRRPRAWDNAVIGTTSPPPTTMLLAQRDKAEGSGDRVLRKSGENVLPTGS